MHNPGQKASVIVSIITVFSVTAIAAGVYLRRAISNKRSAAKEASETDDTGPSLVEQLVSHNTQGF